MADGTTLLTRPTSDAISALVREPLGAQGRWSDEFEAAMVACADLRKALFAAQRAVAKAKRSDLTPAQTNFCGELLADLHKAPVLPRSVGAAQTWDERQRALANGHVTTEWRLVTGSSTYASAADLFASQGYA